MQKPFFPFLRILFNRLLLSILSLLYFAPQSFAVESLAPTAGVSTAVRHSVEAEAILTNGLAYRYRNGDQNFCIGMGERWISRAGVEGFFNYQNRLGSFQFPLDTILYMTARRKTHTVEEFGEVTISRREYRLGVGMWFAPTLPAALTERIYFPISFGVSYPLYVESKLTSDTADPATIRNLRSDLAPYLRVGVGYAF